MAPPPPSIQRPSHQRLANLKRPERARTLADAPNRKAKKAKSCCDAPELSSEDGRTVCLNCGKEINEDSIVAEVTFAETSAGAAVVQGSQVGENQRYAKNTMSMGFRGRGGEGTESREQTERNGRTEINSLGNSLHLPEHISSQAFNIYKLALNNNFTQGRSPRLVAAVCLYVACRQQPDNKTLLMDLAERIKVNVFKVGEVYKTLCKELFIEEATSQRLNRVEVEPLIDKFARKLEFGEFHNQVATDAVKILSRMNRDWMVTGRTPAGLCGACIILAARMNNFRRTVREVVYVVRVADVTILKRLEEFKRTKAGSLSVDQFRTLSHRLKDTALPPAMYNAQLKKGKKVKRVHSSQDDASDSESVAEPTTGSARSSVAPETEPSSKRQRVDKDGFAIPAIPVRAEKVAKPAEEIPIDPELLQAVDIARDELGEDADSVVGDGDDDDGDTSSVLGDATSDVVPVKRGRKKKEKPTPPVITEADLMVEEELETIIKDTITSTETNRIMNDEFIADSHARAKALADSMRIDTSKLDAEEIGEDEFEDDPEVANCKLNPAEIAIKERIWVTHNEDWMRQQQARLLEKELAEARGKKKGKPRGKRSRIGDGAVIEGQDINSPVDAVTAMTNKRAGRNFSQHVDYQKLQAIYGLQVPEGSPEPSEIGDDEEELGAGSQKAASAASNSRSPERATGSTLQPSVGLPTPAATQIANSSQAALPVLPALPENNEQAPMVIESDPESDESDEDDVHDDEVVVPNYGVQEDDDEEEEEMEEEPDDFGPQYD